MIIMIDIKNMAVINDLSGSDRCSLGVAIPVITAMGIHCCAMPTAILSNHTGYDEYYFEKADIIIRNYPPYESETDLILKELTE